MSNESYDFYKHVIEDAIKELKVQNEKLTEKIESLKTEMKESTNDKINTVKQYITLGFGGIGAIMGTQWGYILALEQKFYDHTQEFGHIGVQKLLEQITQDIHIIQCAVTELC